MLSSSSRTRLWSPILYCIGGLILCSFLLSACGSIAPTDKKVTPTSPSPMAVPNDLIAPGVLTIGSYTAYPPQEYIDPATKQATGFDIELIRAIAQKMGLKTLIVSTNFHSIIDGLIARNFDVVISAVSITMQLQKKVDFVPYFKGGESLLVEKSNPRHVTDVDDLCGQRIGAQIGTIEQNDLAIASERCQQNGKSPIASINMPDRNAVIQLLEIHRIIAAYMDAPITDYAIKQHPGLFELGGPIYNASPEGIVVRKDDTSMHCTIKAAFVAVEADGTYRKLIEAWGLTNEAIAFSK